MQIKRIKVTEVRLEYPISISLETQEEVDQLFAVLNFTPIGQAIERDDNDWGKIWNYLDRYKSLDYLKWHEKLRKKLER